MQTRGRAVLQSHEDKKREGRQEWKDSCRLFLLSLLSGKKTDKKTEKPDSDRVLFWARVTGGCAVAIFACVLILTMTIMSYTPRINSILANLDEISVELEESSRDVSAIMKSMNEEGLGKMYETLDNIQRIDIDKLNDSIDSLYRIINPLSQIFK